MYQIEFCFSRDLRRQLTLGCHIKNVRDFEELGRKHPALRKVHFVLIIWNISTLYWLHGKNVGKLSWKIQEYFSNKGVIITPDIKVILKAKKYHLTKVILDVLVIVEQGRFLTTEDALDQRDAWQLILVVHPGARTGVDSSRNRILQL